MSLVKKTNPTLIKPKKSYAFKEEFFSKTERSDHPYRMALHTYNQLSETSGSQEEMYLFMVEDIIFSSLYATFYEHLLFTLKDNLKVAIPLIEHFEKDHDERERLISEQTQHHLEFILNNGQCPGCPVCDNHGDVKELVQIFHSGDFEFFKTLYVGMQTIQFAMEELIYDLTPDRLEWAYDYNPESILDFRQSIIEFVEKKKAC